MRMIASLLVPETQLFQEAKPREIFDVKGGNKIAIVRRVSKKVFYYTEKTLFVGDENFLDGKQIGVIQL